MLCLFLLYSKVNQLYMHICVFAVMFNSLRLHGLQLPGSSVLGIFQARILESVAMSSSRGSSPCRDLTSVSPVSFVDRQILYHCTTWGALYIYMLKLLLSRFSHVRLCATPQTAATRLPRPWDSAGKNTGVGCHFLLQCMKVKSESEVAQLCPTLSNPMDCSPPGSSVHGIFQARVLEWGAIAFSDIYTYIPSFLDCLPIQVTTKH